MSRGYRSWSVWSSERITWSSWSPWSSWTAWASWHSSEGDVEGVSDVLWVLMLRANGRVVSPRYKGSRDDLCGRHQGFCRHSKATVRVNSDGHPLLAVPFSVWAFWAARFDNCWCASDLYIDRRCRFVFSVWVGGCWVYFNVMPFMVWLS